MLHVRQISIKGRGHTGMKCRTRVLSLGKAGESFLKADDSWLSLTPTRFSDSVFSSVLCNSSFTPILSIILGLPLIPGLSLTCGLSLTPELPLIPGLSLICRTVHLPVSNYYTVSFLKARHCVCSPALTVATEKYMVGHLCQTQMQ